MKTSIVVAAFALATTVTVVYAEKARTATGGSVTRAVALLVPTQGQKAKGTVAFTQEGDRVHVVGDVVGLEPGSTHGFHIHEFGDCSAPDASTAGDHFAPKGNAHGAPDAAAHHAGDLGNIKADASGNARIDVRVAGPTVARGDTTILGRAVVLHEKADDLKTQPSGNSGARIACGVIGAAKDARPGG
jgi:superoxide dismutase, Cu-Zn family